MFGVNSYTLQLNTQLFICNTAYTGSKNAACWEQFVFGNDGGGLLGPDYASGTVFIQYWLVGYYNQMGVLVGYDSCPTAGIPGGDDWTLWSGYGLGFCYANSAGTTTPPEPASNLGNLSLSALAGSVNDQVVLTDNSTGHFWTVTVTDGVLNLSQSWQDAEFNVFGYGDGSQANFNEGMSTTVNDVLMTGAGTPIQPSCQPGGYTAETNNLTLGSCFPLPYDYLSFTENLSGVALSPPLGPVGTSVAITGSGFIASQSLTVTYDGSTDGMPTTCATDVSGDVISGCTFVVPPSAAGNHTVMVSDGTYSPTATFTVVKFSPSLATMLSFSTITVGGSVHDSAKLTGATSDAGGTITYYLMNSVSKLSVTVGSPVAVTNGVVPDSISKTFTSAGSYGWGAYYSGDANNNGTGASLEPLTVNKASPSVSTSLSHLAIVAGQSAYDAATLKGSFRAGGTVTYEYFSGGTCSGTPVKVGVAVTVKNGIVPSSASHVFGTAGTYGWKAVYSGDQNNKRAISPCEKLTVLKATTLPTHTTVSCTKSSFTQGTKVTCTTSVTGGHAPRTGTITWSRVSGTGGVTFSSKTCTLSSGKCSVTIMATAAGSVKLQATYSGDPHNPWSSGTRVLTIR